MSKYRFKTEEEFKKDGCWLSSNNTPRGWSVKGEMNRYLGQIIPEHLNSACDSKLSINYGASDDDNGITWVFKPEDYVLNEPEEKNKTRLKESDLISGEIYIYDGDLIVEYPSGAHICVNECREGFSPNHNWSWTLALYHATERQKKHLRKCIAAGKYVKIDSENNEDIFTVGKPLSEINLVDRQIACYKDGNSNEVFINGYNLKNYNSQHITKVTDEYFEVSGFTYGWFKKSEALGYNKPLEKINPNISTDSFIKGIWYKNENGNFGKCVKFINDRLSASELFIHKYEIFEEEYEFCDGYKWSVASQAEIDKILPDGHPDKSNSIPTLTPLEICRKKYKKGMLVDSADKSSEYSGKFYIDVEPSDFTKTGDGVDYLHSIGWLYLDGKYAEIISDKSSEFEGIGVDQPQESQLIETDENMDVKIPTHKVVDKTSITPVYSVTVDLVQTKKNKLF